VVVVISTSPQIVKFLLNYFKVDYFEN